MHWRLVDTVRLVDGVPTRQSYDVFNDLAAYIDAQLARVKEIVDTSTDFAYAGLEAAEVYEWRRGDWTRTSDLHVPNVAPYQLGHTPTIEFVPYGPVSRNVGPCRLGHIRTKFNCTVGTPVRQAA